MYETENAQSRKCACFTHTHTHTHTDFHRVAIFVMMLFMLMLKPDVGWGQEPCVNDCIELVENTNLDIQGVTFPQPLGYAQSSFEKFWVPNGNGNFWYSSHNSPHHIQYQPNHCNYAWTSTNGTETNCLFASFDSDSFTEGVYTNNVIVDDTYLDYCINLVLQKLQCYSEINTHNVHIAVTSELTPAVQGLTPDPLPTNQHQILHSEFFGQNFDEVPISIRYTPTGDGFNQFWIYTEPLSGGGVATTIKDVHITCTTRALSGIRINEISNLIYNVNAINESEISTFQTYNWTVTNNVTNSTVFSSNEVEPQIPFPEAGTYNICVAVVDNNRCCADTCTTVIICGAPDADFTAIGSCPTYSFTPTQPDPDATYSWDFGDGASSADQNPSHTYTSNGTYTVKLRVTKCGITTTSTQTVVVDCVRPNCADSDGCISIGTPGGTVLLSSLIAGPNPIIPHTTWFFAPVIENQCFNLEGTLVLDVSGAFFINTTWYCGPGSSIRINDFGVWGSHWFVDSELLGCKSMWRGIVLEPNPLGNFFVGGLSLRNTIIYDAYRGVELAPGRVLDARGSSFIDNYVGAFVPANGFNYFEDCRFENTNAMLPAYLGQPSWAKRMFAGIHGNGVTLVRVTGTEGNSRSLFRNLSYGIYTFNSGVAVDNSRFVVDDVTSLNNIYTSYGIYENFPNSASLIQGNKFFNHSGQIFSRNGKNNSIYIYSNEFNNQSDFGEIKNCVHISNSTNLGAEINQNNTFNISGVPNSVRSIEIYDCPYNLLKIDENTFNQNTKGDNGHVPISITNCTPQNDFGFFRNNILNSNEKGTCWLTNSPKLVCLYNESKVKGSKFYQLNSNELFFKGNTNVNTAEQDFVFSNIGTNSKYCCNTSNSINGKTFDFVGGGNENVKFVGNQLNSLELTNGTIIGQQPSHGNIFTATSLARATTFSGSTYFEANQFNVDPSHSGFRPVTIDPSQFISDWFPSNGVFNECGDVATCNSVDLEIPVIDPDSMEYRTALLMSEDEADRLVNNFRLTNIVLTDENYPNRERHRWNNYYNLHKSMVDHPEVNWNEKLVEHGVFNDFIDNLTQGMKSWDEAERLRAGIYTMSDAQFSLYSSNHKILKNGANLIKDWYMQASNDKDENELQALYSTLHHAHDRLKSLTSEMDEMAESRLESLNELLQNLEESYSFLQERKAVWVVENKMRQHGMSNISESEWDDVRRISKLCPEVYGSAVFEAFGLLIVKGEAAINYNFENACIDEVEIRSKVRDNTTNLRIYPNPSSNKIHVEWGTFSVDKIEILDISSSLIKNMFISHQNNEQNIDISALKNGVYMCRLFYKDQLVGTERFIKLD